MFSVADLSYIMYVFMWSKAEFLLFSWFTLQWVIMSDQRHGAGSCLCVFFIAYATSKQKMFLRPDGKEQSIASSILQMY